MTVLTRKTSNPDLDPSVNVTQVDYDSLESLTNAFRGQDAVVSTIGSAALDKQLLMVKAAADAKVKRFIPSEFGSDTVHEKTSKIPFFADKVAVQDVLRKEAASGRMTYTIICNGPFFDWGMMVGLIINIKDKFITLYDGGSRVFSTTSLATIGKTVASVLKNSETTENRAVYVQDTAITQKQLEEMGKKAVGPDGWREEVVSITDLLDQAREDPAKHGFNYIKAAIWGEGYGSHFQVLDNELLGIKEMTEAEIQGLVDSFAK